MRLITLKLTVIVLLGLTMGPVFAQSQDDINPEFDASSEEGRAILLNYDCSNIPWPESDPKTGKTIVSTYRKFTLDDPSKPVTTYYVPEGVSTLEIEVNPGNFVAAPPPALIAGAENQTGGNVVCVFTEESTGKRAVIPANLIPPTIQQIENYVLEAVFLFWAFLGIFSTVSLMYIALKFMLSRGNKVRNEEVLTQGMYWLLGLLLAIFAIPGLYFVFDLLNISTTECYRYSNDQGDEEFVYDLTVPGFTFFFSEVCTGPFGVENPSGT